MRRALGWIAIATSIAFAGCWVEDADYAEFQVSCARERCPEDLCCNAARVCVEGTVDDLGECSEPTEAP